MIWWPVFPRGGVLQVEVKKSGAEVSQEEKRQEIYYNLDPKCTTCEDRKQNRTQNYQEWGSPSTKLLLVILLL